MNHENKKLKLLSLGQLIFALISGTTGILHFKYGNIYGQWTTLITVLSFGLLMILKTIEYFIKRKKILVLIHFFMSILNIAVFIDMYFELIK